MTYLTIFKEHTEGYWQLSSFCTVVPVVDLMDTARNLYLREFRKHAKKGNLEDKLREDGAFTVFAPQNKAIQQAPSRIKDRLSRKDDENLILYHMTNDRLHLHQLINNIDIPSLYKGYPPLKINRYSNGVSYHIWNMR